MIFHQLINLILFLISYLIKRFFLLKYKIIFYTYIIVYLLKFILRKKVIIVPTLDMAFLS